MIFITIFAESIACISDYCTDGKSIFSEVKRLRNIEYKFSLLFIHILNKYYKHGLL